MKISINLFKNISKIYVKDPIINFNNYNFIGFEVKNINDQFVKLELSNTKLTVLDVIFEGLLVCVENIDHQKIDQIMYFDLANFDAELWNEMLFNTDKDNFGIQIKENVFINNSNLSDELCYSLMSIFFKNKQLKNYKFNVWKEQNLVSLNIDNFLTVSGLKTLNLICLEQYFYKPLLNKNILNLTLPFKTQTELEIIDEILRVNQYFEKPIFNYKTDFKDIFLHKQNIFIQTKRNLNNFLNSLNFKDILTLNLSDFTEVNYKIVNPISDNLSSIPKCLGVKHIDFEENVYEFHQFKDNIYLELTSNSSILIQIILIFIQNISIRNINMLYKNSSFYLNNKEIISLNDIYRNNFVYFHACINITNILDSLNKIWYVFSNCFKQKQKQRKTYEYNNLDELFNTLLRKMKNDIIDVYSVYQNNGKFYIQLNE